MKPRSSAPVLAFGAGGAAVVVACGVIGWLSAGYSTSDALYRTLQAFTLGDAYGGLSRAALPPLTELLLQTARWVGAALAFSAILLLVGTALRSGAVALRARTSRGHLIVLGDSPFANRLSELAAGEALRLRVVQGRTDVSAPDERARLLRLPLKPIDRNVLDEFGAARARRLVIATTDDAETLDLALAAQRRYPRLSILARLGSARLSQLHDLPGGETLRTFSEPAAAAREIVRRHPLFLLAEDRGQSRVDALLLGDDVWLAPLLVEVILCSRTLKLGKPRLRLVSRDSVELHRRLMSAYPELAEEAELSLHPLDCQTCGPKELPLSEIDRLTAVFCAFQSGTESLASALEMRRQLQGAAGFSAPIFVTATGDAGLERLTPGIPLKAGTIIPFGAPRDIVGAAGILSKVSDQAERAWHAAYLRLYPQSDAAVPWDQLSEAYRLSNRRAVAHVYAKLFEVGFDLRSWLATAKPWDELPALAPGEALFRSEAELLRLAELEHERWNADRRLLGWRYCATKDPVRKHHPALVNFADLPAELQRYDVELVRALDQILPRRRDGLRRR